MSHTIVLSAKFSHKLPPGAVAAIEFGNYARIGYSKSSGDEVRHERIIREKFRATPGAKRPHSDLLISAKLLAVSLVHDELDCSATNTANLLNLLRQYRNAKKSIYDESVQEDISNAMYGAGFDVLDLVSIKQPAPGNYEAEIHYKRATDDAMLSKLIVAYSGASEIGQNYTPDLMEELEMFAASAKFHRVEEIQLSLFGEDASDTAYSNLGKALFEPNSHGQEAGYTYDKLDDYDDENSNIANDEDHF